MTKMKNVFLISILLALTSCAATREAQANLEKEANDVKAATIELVQATQMGATEEQLNTLEENLNLQIKEAKEATLKLVEAGKSDFAALKSGGIGLLEGGLGGGVGLLGVGLSWWLRDKRKKRGMDPLQRTDAKWANTAPTTAYNATPPPFVNPDPHA